MVDLEVRLLENEVGVVFEGKCLAEVVCVTACVTRRWGETMWKCSWFTHYAPMTFADFKNVFMREFNARGFPPNIDTLIRIAAQLHPSIAITPVKDEARVVLTTENVDKVFRLYAHKDMWVFHLWEYRDLHSLLHSIRLLPRQYTEAYEKLKKLQQCST